MAIREEARRIEADLATSGTGDAKATDSKLSGRGRATSTAHDVSMLLF